MKAPSSDDEFKLDCTKCTLYKKYFGYCNVNRRRIPMGLNVELDWHTRKPRFTFFSNDIRYNIIQKDDNGVYSIRLWQDVWKRQN